MLVLASMYFALKFLVHWQFSLDKRGRVPHARDPDLNAKKKSRYERLIVRDSLYSQAGVGLPIFYPILLAAMGIDVPACLFPSF